MNRRPIFRRRRTSWLSWAGRVFVATVGLWLAGFVMFVVGVSTSRVPDPPPKVDGIVALTGGDGRVGAGLALLAERAAPLMLISGAGRGTYLGDFTGDDAIAATRFAGAITIGHQAETTRGNAAELARWAHRYGMTSLLIVTADYHMPRAMRLIRNQLPGVKLIGYPVSPPAMKHVFTLATLRILAVEYSKYLVVCVGLDGFVEDNFGTTSS